MGVIVGFKEGSTLASQTALQLRLHHFLTSPHMPIPTRQALRSTFLDTQRRLTITSPRRLSGGHKRIHSTILSVTDAWHDMQHIEATLSRSLADIIA